MEAKPGPRACPHGGSRPTSLPWHSCDSPHGAVARRAGTMRVKVRTYRTIGDADNASVARVLFGRCRSETGRGERCARLAFRATTDGIPVARAESMERTWVELLERGDRAARSGDRATLARIARLLSGRIGDPLADTLLELARDCSRGASYARHAWPPLRQAVAHRISIAGT
jgi:hypothetical protein